MKLTNVISFFGVRSALREGKPLSDAIRVGRQIASEMIEDGMMKPSPKSRGKRKSISVPVVTVGLTSQEKSVLDDLVADAFDDDVIAARHILDRAIKNIEKET